MATDACQIMCHSYEVGIAHYRPSLAQSVWNDQDEYNEEVDSYLLNSRPVGAVLSNSTKASQKGSFIGMFKLGNEMNPYDIVHLGPQSIHLESKINDYNGNLEDDPRYFSTGGALSLSFPGKVDGREVQMTDEKRKREKNCDKGATGEDDDGGDDACFETLEMESTISSSILSEKRQASNPCNKKEPPSTAAMRYAKQQQPQHQDDLTPTSRAQQGNQDRSEDDNTNRSDSGGQKSVICKSLADSRSNSLDEDPERGDEEEEKEDEEVPRRRFLRGIDDGELSFESTWSDSIVQVKKKKKKVKRRNHKKKEKKKKEKEDRNYNYSIPDPKFASIEKQLARIKDTKNMSLSRLEEELAVLSSTVRGLRSEVTSGSGDDYENVGKDNDNKDNHQSSLSSLDYSTQSMSASETENVPKANPTDTKCNKNVMNLGEISFSSEDSLNGDDEDDDDDDDDNNVFFTSEDFSLSCTNPQSKLALGDTLSGDEGVGVNLIAVRREDSLSYFFLDAVFCNAFSSPARNSLRRQSNHKVLRNGLKRPSFRYQAVANSWSEKGSTSSGMTFSSFDDVSY